MKRLMALVMAMAFLVASFGCSGAPREAKVKCAKCGAVFTIDEGIKALERQP